MEYNNPSELIKDLAFGNEASEKIISGVDKLARAVKSTLGASGKCVIYEDSMGKPVITKDGVTVAESVVLFDPVENIGATLIKEAAKNTVKEAGDGTTTATVLAQALLREIRDRNPKSIREVKIGIEKGLEKINKHLDDTKIEVKDNMLRSVASISCNNDVFLGGIVSEAFEKVGKNGVVLMEESEDEKTYVDVIDGAQFPSGLKSQHLATNDEKTKAILERPYVLVVASPITNLRKIISIMELVIKNDRSLLIVGNVEQQPSAALMMNKVKGNAKVNFVDPPGFGQTKIEAMEDIAVLTGATLINEELGDDMDLITPDVLGEAKKAVTDNSTTIITIDGMPEAVQERIKIIEDKIKTETNPFLKKKHEERLATLSGAVAIVKVGAESKVELKEKKDRVEDAIFAVKAALKEGIVAGGGVALVDASKKLDIMNIGESILANAITAPYRTILENAGIDLFYTNKENHGVNVVTGESVNMIDAGVIDPVLVTKTALKNAISVVNTIVSADCVISNMRQS
jgi:chaperonin GroEL